MPTFSCASCGTGFYKRLVLRSMPLVCRKRRKTSDVEEANRALFKSGVCGCCCNPFYHAQYGANYINKNRSHEHHPASSPKFSRGGHLGEIAERV